MINTEPAGLRELQTPQIDCGQIYFNIGSSLANWQRGRRK